MKIKTHYDQQPIPFRGYDWSAVDDDTYDDGGPIGLGKTEIAAVIDLMNQLLDELENVACPSTVWKQPSSSSALF